MKRPKTGTLLMGLFLLLWAAAMVGLVVIGFTNIQPAGIGSSSSTNSAPISQHSAETTHDE
ncbi:MAG: hypothetical protein ACP5GA_07745 [Acidithiobacillus sp.]|uniref:hypothetical protein n=1 Tax=Acidithiobacillus sp. TaxID=1872118 RepID=UPI0025BE79CF|nr:hypothetical protein [Acidithiobacillus sp.]